MKKLWMLVVAAGLGISLMGCAKQPATPTPAPVPEAKSGDAEAPKEPAPDAAAPADAGKAP